jgi:hypothetical protein
MFLSWKSLPPAWLLPICLWAISLQQLRYYILSLPWLSKFFNILFITQVKSHFTCLAICYSSTLPLATNIVLVSYCCCNNVHKHGGLMQYKCILWRAEVPKQFLWYETKVSAELVQSDISRRESSSGFFSP